MKPPEWREILDRYPADCRPIGPVEALGNAGGFSGSRLWRFDAARGRLVLRAWPEFAASGTLVERDSGWNKPATRALAGWAGLDQINGWLRVAGSLPFVPKPLRASDGRPTIEGRGQAWSLSPWMPGTADLARPPSHNHIQAAFGGLAAFHRRFTSERMAPSPGIAARMADLEHWVGGDFARVRDRLPPVGIDPRADLARVWIDRAARKAQPLRGLLGSVADVAVPIQSCLRDARPDHFLFEGDRLTGLIDYGAMGLDAVAIDLARLMGEWFGPDPTCRDVALRAYEAIRPLSPEERRLIPVFEAANAMLGAGRWVRWHFTQNRTFDDPDAVLHGLRRGIDRLEEADLPPPPGRITS